MSRSWDVSPGNPEITAGANAPILIFSPLPMTLVIVIGIDIVGHMADNAVQMMKGDLVLNRQAGAKLKLDHVVIENMAALSANFVISCAKAICYKQQGHKFQRLNKPVETLRSERQALTSDFALWLQLWTLPARSGK